MWKEIYPILSVYRLNESWRLFSRFKFADGFLRFILFFRNNFMILIFSVTAFSSSFNRQAVFFQSWWQNDSKTSRTRFFILLFGGKVKIKTDCTYGCWSYLTVSLWHPCGLFYGWKWLENSRLLTATAAAVAHSYTWCGLGEYYKIKNMAKMSKFHNQNRQIFIQQFSNISDFLGFCR